MTDPFAMMMPAPQVRVPKSSYTKKGPGVKHVQGEGPTLAKRMRRRRGIPTKVVYTTSNKLPRMVRCGVVSLSSWFRKNKARLNGGTNVFRAPRLPRGPIVKIPDDCIRMRQGFNPR